MEIDQKLRQSFIDEYYEGVKKKWNNKPEQQVKVLEKLTNFKPNELLALKNLFPENDGVSIKIEDFVRLVKLYFETLKESCPKDTIL